MTPCLPSLNSDILLHIGSFLSFSDAVALTVINKDMKANSDEFLRDQYVKHIGKISLNILQQVDKKIIARLLCCADKQPNAAVNHNIYKAQSNTLEWWKWIVGVENNHDKEAQKNYNNAIHLIENSLATSIVQLKNQMQIFWHLDRQIKDYKKFKSNEKALLKSCLINRIFFACIEFLFKVWYNKTALTTGKKLESRSRETFAKIGGFNLDSIDYDVVAFHILADEDSRNPHRIYHDDTHFNSITYGNTHVGIFEREKHHSFTLFGGYGPNQNFSVLIGRETVDAQISHEGCISQGDEAVLNSKRHLLIHDNLRYAGTTLDAQGSDRILDQKLTQIMVEMTMQNKKIISLQVNSNGDDLPVLTAGGFKSGNSEKLINELMKFRSEAGNKLFPPYHDYSSANTKFETNNFTGQNVRYSKEVIESWSDIIQRDPILSQDSAILPEYWAIKPNVID